MSLPATHRPLAAAAILFLIVALVAGPSRAQGSTTVTPLEGLASSTPLASLATETASDPTTTPVPMLLVDSTETILGVRPRLGHSFVQMTLRFNGLSLNDASADLIMAATAEQVWLSAKRVLPS